MMTSRRDISTIVLVIIDQLRADDLQYLPRCRDVLTYEMACKNVSIPASTEAMHANISTGSNPKIHGFISKTTKEGRRGLEEYVGKMHSGQLKSLAAMAAAKGYQTTVIGGKPETVLAMGTRNQCRLRIYSPDKRLFADGSDPDLARALNTVLSEDLRPVTDLGLIELFARYFMNNSKSRQLGILTLPNVDRLGHVFGSHSEQVKRYLRTLDDTISNMLELSDSATIITGDHGCRNTTRYVIEASENDPRKVLVYQKCNSGYLVAEKYCLDAEGRLLAVQYDGGILRLWFEELAELSLCDREFLSRYGVMHTKDSGNLYHANSIHENLGDVVVVAAPDTTFCKASWIKKDVYTKIASSANLGLSDLPLGEHGTYHAEDTDVSLISNIDFGLKHVDNTEIAKLVLSLMGHP